MATPLSKVLDKLSKGTLVPAKEIREAIKRLEINTLRLTEKELERLIRVVDIEKESTAPATVKSAKNLQRLIDEGTALEGGGLELAPTTYTQLSNIGKRLGKTDDTGYHLGHEGLSNLSQSLSVIIHNYRVGGQRHLTHEEIRLLESAVLGAQVIERLPQKNLEELKLLGSRDEAILLKALEGSPDYLDQDLIATSNFDLQLKLGSAKVVYTFEDKGKNLVKGGLSSSLSKRVRKLLGDVNKIESDAIGKRLQELFSTTVDPFNISSSPTFTERVEDLADDLLLGTKKSKKSTSKVRLHRRIKTDNSAAKKLKNLIKIRTKNLKTKIEAARKKKAFVIPTVTLKSIINESLAQFIRLRMQDARSNTSPAYLRNITGTFSESAYILTLNREQSGMLRGIYSYGKNPYSVFEPPGRLASVGRNPKLYIEGAIRDIAMQVLKNKFKGIALEVD